jgi:hypothetical protein
MSFADLVRDELRGARMAHANLHSSHEAYAVLLEEVEEFWEEVRKKVRLRDRSRMLGELVQVAAMAQRAAEDLGLLEGQ